MRPFGAPIALDRRCAVVSVSDQGDSYPTVIGPDDLEPVPWVDGSVERCPLPKGPAQRLHQNIEIALGDLLAMLGAGGSGDVLVHEGATQIIDAGL